MYRPKSTFLDTAQHVFTRLNTSPDLPRLNRIILKQGLERWQRYYGEEVKFLFLLTKQLKSCIISIQIIVCI